MPDPRLATPHDVEAIRQCARLAYSPYVSRIGKPPAPMVADFDTHVEKGQAFVLDDQGSGLCGYVIILLTDRYLFLENVAVSPGQQGKGFGRLLIEFAEHKAAEAQLAAVRLYTNIHMRENVALYSALGYIEYDRRREDGFDRVYFEKTVS